jgi:hypothetical protein
MAKGWGWPAPPPCHPASLFLLYKSHSSWLPNLFIHIAFCYYKLKILVLNFVVEIHSI